MTLVALISAYREGPLVHGAISSALQATPNVFVFEGPAGAPLDAEVPDTDYSMWGERITIKHGSWKTDAKKRTKMVEACRRFPKPVWAVWLDGDEILRNPEVLGDWCRYWSWLDEHEQATEPRIGWPIRLVELDGSVAICRGKVVRVDLIDGYSVSSSVFKNTLGFTHGEGNVPELLRDKGAGFGDRMMIAVDLNRMIVPSWLVAEPYLVHRSMLRHPLRQPLRMHAQEAGEIKRGKKRAKAEGWKM